jgi:hypothetical protein
MGDSLAAAPCWSFQRIYKSSGAPTAGHLGGACLTGFAVNDAIGARATMTIGSTIVSGRVLFKFPTDFLADTFGLFDAVLADRCLASERRDTKAKDANENEKEGQTSHGNLH